MSPGIRRCHKADIMTFETCVSVFIPPPPPQEVRELGILNFVHLLVCLFVTTIKTNFVLKWDVHAHEVDAHR